MQDRDQRAAFLTQVATTVRDAVKLKRVMLKKGLHRAKAKCPECEGYLQGALIGPKPHLRMWCTGSCKRSMLE